MSIRKEDSPKLRVAVNNYSLEATIDEGSEVNCICASAAARAKISYEPVTLSATSAGSHPIHLLGVIKGKLTLSVSDSKSPAFIHLIDTVVVKDLGQDLLIGEPGKADNAIVTLPKDKLVCLRNMRDAGLKGGKTMSSGLNL